MGQLAVQQVFSKLRPNGQGYISLTGLSAPIPSHQTTRLIAITLSLSSPSPHRSYYGLDSSSSSAFQSYEFAYPYMYNARQNSSQPAYTRATTPHMKLPYSNVKAVFYYRLPFPHSQQPTSTYGVAKPRRAVPPYVITLQTVVA